MSGLSERLQKHRALAIMAAIYALAVVFLVPPTDSYPLGDDWDYAATAAEFAETGRLQLGDWPAMTLVSHVVWGASFLRMFGESWSALAASMMVMAWVGGLSIYVLARECNRPPNEAALLCGCYVAAPLVMAFSYSFYTDVTATSLMLMTLAGIPPTVRRDTVRGYAGLGLVAGIAFMARQTAVIPSIILLPLLVFRRRRGAAVAVAAAALLPVLGCYLWLLATDGLPSGFGKISYDVSVLADIKGVIAKLLSIVLEVGLLTLPAAVLWCPGVRPVPSRKGRLRRSLPAAVWIGFIAMFAAELRPYRGWSFYDCGLGILPTYAGAAEALRTPLLTSEVSVFHAVTLALAAVAVAILAAMLWQELERDWQSATDAPPSDFLTRLTIVISTVVYVSLLLVLEFVYDRYLIPLVGLLLAFAATNRCPARSLLTRVAASACLVIVFVCSLLGVQDQMTIKQAYWNSLVELRQEGVSLEQIEHGLVNVDRTPELLFAGMAQVVIVSGDTEATGSAGESATVQRRWKFAFRPEAGWGVNREISYSSWLREGQLLVLQRDAEPSPLTPPVPGR